MSRRCSSPRVVAVALAVAIAGVQARPGSAIAAEPDTVTVARDAYDRGARAYNAGHYAIAAREFSVADELSPNPTALRFALQAAMVLDDPILGMKLVERAERRAAVRELERAPREARAKFARRVGRIALACGESPCRARIDGEPASGSAWVTPGAHAVEWSLGVRQSVQVAAGETVEVSAPPIAGASPVPPLTRKAEPQADRSPPQNVGVSPTWFWVGVAVTTIAGGATVVSGVDTLRRHDAFVADPTSARQHEGQSAERRTNVFVVTTLVAALATAAVGLLLVKWPSTPRADVAWVAPPLH